MTATTQHIVKSFDEQLENVRDSVVRMGGLVEAYQEVARRLGILMENEPPASGGPRLVQ